MGKRALTLTTVAAATATATTVATLQQPAVGAKSKGRERGGRGKAKNESAPSEHSTRSASSPLPMMDITGQVEAAVAAAMREHATPWRTQGSTAGYVPPQGYPPLPPSSAQHAQVQQRTSPQPPQQSRPVPQQQRAAPAQPNACPVAAAPAGPASPPSIDSPFFGACFNCNNTGHRSSECPSRPRCFNCWQLGHMLRECPNHRRRASRAHSCTDAASAHSVA